MAFTFIDSFQKKSLPWAMQLSSLARRIKLGPLFRWRFTGFLPYEILAIPPELRPQDKSLARDFYNGWFPLAGRIVEAGSVSPFCLVPPSRPWCEALQSFSWLRHLSAGHHKLASAHARALLQQWQQHCASPITGLAWQGDIVGSRIISWLTHAPFLFQEAQETFIKDFMRSLGFQVRYLLTAVEAMPPNERCLKAHIGLAFAAVCLPLSAPESKKIFQRLSAQLTEQILPDGGHISRSPVVLLELLTDLIALRQTFVQKNQRPPQMLVACIERMFPALRFFLHQDNTLAGFHGTGPLCKERLENLFRWDDSQGEPFTYAPYSGYQRLAFGQTTVLADVGNSPASVHSHRADAGCLSFEMSCRGHRFIINSGIDPFGLGTTPFMGRTTAAHSTVTLNDRSSCTFKKIPSAFANDCETIITRGTHIRQYRLMEEPGHAGFIATHDGYLLSDGLLHERGLLIREDGKCIEGFDHLFSPNGETAAADGNTKAALRFHLHPDISISHEMSGNIRLQSLDGTLWVFSCAERQAQLEDSIYFAAVEGPQRTRQLVVYFHPSLQSKIHWRFTQIT